MALAKFLIFSGLGIFMFFVNVEIGGKNVIIIQHMINFVKATCGPVIPYYALAMATKFTIAVTSVSAILFFSASIPSLLSTDIPVKMKDVILIWIERTILSIIFAGAIAHLLF